MKKTFFALFVTCALALLFSAQIFAQETTSSCPFRPDEVSVRMGYSWTELNPENRENSDFRFYPLFVDLGYGLNSWFHLEDHKGKLQFLLEPFFAFSLDPSKDYSGGMNFLLHYSYPVMERLSPYAELGTGVMYFGVETYEQEKVGFNFYDQLGGGIRYKINERTLFNVGYRRTHISDLGLRDKRNAGVNADMVLAGVTFLY